MSTQNDAASALDVSTGWVVGAWVVDDDGETGTIIEIEDAHNVHVAIKCEHGEGRAIYCCVPSCPEYFPCRLTPTPNK